jgi:thioredoxin-like negative regulator of GroEL
LASLDAALALCPGEAEALGNRGAALKALGRTRDALDSLDAAARIAPENAKIQFNRGLLLRELGRCAEAAQAFESVLARFSDHIAAMTNLGLVLFECDRVEEAMRLFRRQAETQRQTGAPGAGDPEHKQRHDAQQRAHLALSLGPNPPAFHLEAGARLQTAVLNCANDPAAIARRWQTARPQMVVIDDLLTGEALEALRRFCQGSTIWRKPYDNGYLGAIPEYGFACPLLAEIAQGLRGAHPAIFGPHPLRYLWAFTCDGAHKGVNIHADFAAVNVNFWITPDEANLDPAHGGLVVWDVAAPLDWDFARYNNDETAIRAFLAQKGAKSVTIPYRANRAVIFDSDLFHETDKIAFKDGYANRRMNVTMLYGRRRVHEGLAANTQKGLR